MLNVDWNVGPYCVACHVLVWWLGETFPTQIMWLARLGASTYLGWRINCSCRMQSSFSVTVLTVDRHIAPTRR